MIVIIFVIASLAGLHAQTQKTVPIQLNYATNEVVILGADEKALTVADANCGHTAGAAMTICAELRENWNWNPFRGLVFMDVYNTSALSNRIETSRNGTYPPYQCIEIARWPGGDIFIQVQANGYDPVLVTTSVKIKPTGFVSSMSSEVVPTEPRPVFDGQVIQMIPYVVTPDPITLEFDQTIILEMDLCSVNVSDPSIKVHTTVMADTGIYTHYICKDLPCTPDNNVIGAQRTPTPVGLAEGNANSNIPKVYVAIYNAGGEPNSDVPPKYFGKFWFGAYFKF